MKLLIIDDNQAIHVSLRYLLADMFDTIIALPHPDKVLTTIDTERPDLLLLDMNFDLGTSTGQAGLFWTEQIHRRHPDLPIVLMTAYANISLAVRGLKLGAADFVEKPWDNQQLRAIILNTLHHQPAIESLAEHEQQHIRNALNRCHGNISLAAEMLGVSRQTLYNKLKRQDTP